MAITVGPMQLIESEPNDVIEDQVCGTAPGGGFWTNWSRLSGHDHSGGLMGTPVAVSIPDGSITTADLDPSVLLPYALTDGSKPFTGAVTLQADAVVRDRLSFGEQGTALAPDAHLTRTGAGLLSLSGAWHAPSGAFEVKTGAAPGITRFAVDQVGNVGAGLSYSIDTDSTDRWLQYRNAGTQPLWKAGTSGVEGDYFLYRWKSPGTDGPYAGLRVARATGTVTLTPDSGVVALTHNAPGNFIVGSAGAIVFDPTANIVAPNRDNAISSGWSSGRWTAVYAVAGAINTSLAEAKTDITPLDPAAALAAVRATDPVVFDYRPPERTAEWYELPDDPEQAEQVLLQRLTAAPLEAGARHQAGFVLADATGQYQTDALFETGSGQSSPSNTAGILLAAIKALDSRVAALEGA